MNRTKSILVLPGIMLVLAFAANAFSQTVDATVPVKVDIAATVKIEPVSGNGIGADGSVTADTEKTFNIKLPTGVGVITPSSSSGGGSGTSSSSGSNSPMTCTIASGQTFAVGTQFNATASCNGQALNTVTWVPANRTPTANGAQEVTATRVSGGDCAGMTASCGTINVGTTAMRPQGLQFNQDVTVSLYSVKGNKVQNNTNLPAGVYLLTVKGSGKSFVKKLAHNGGVLNVNASSFGDFGYSPSAPNMVLAKAGDYGKWRVTVSAEGYVSQSQNFEPDAGSNALISFTMKKTVKPTKASFTETVNGTSFDMIYIKGGEFTIGCTGSTCPGDAVAVSGVKLSDYFIAKAEVTNGLWKAVMGNDDPRLPAYAQNSGSMGNMTWYDAFEFACKLSQITGKNYRMTTEAEWEYAARGLSNQYSAASSGMSNIGGTGVMAGEEWAYNSWEGTHTGGTDPVGKVVRIDGKINLHTQKTRRDVNNNFYARLIRSIEGIGPALRLAISADADFPPNYVPTCETHVPEMGAENANSYRDMRWVTGSEKHWTKGGIAIGDFDLRVWEDGTARLGSTNGQWFTSNNIMFVFVPSSGSVRRFPYILLDETQGSLISELGFMNGGFIGRIAKETTTSVTKPSVTLAASAEALARAQSDFKTYYQMVNMENIPTAAQKQDARLIDGPSNAWFQNNTTAGGQHHYRKDVDADEFRFTVNQLPSSQTILANGKWFTVNNTFLRVTHSNGYTAEYLYAVSSNGNNFYHNSFMAYERGDFRMFEKVSNSSYSFPCQSTCDKEIDKGKGSSFYANSGDGGKSTYVPAPCPVNGCPAYEP